MAHLGYSKRFGVGVALFIAGLVFFGFAVYEFTVVGKLKRNAVQTDATVVDKRETRGSKGRKKLSVELRFVDAAGQEHRMSHSGSKLVRLSVGDTVRVMYLRDEPETVRIVGENKLGGYIVAGVFFLLVGLWLALPPLLAAGRTVS